VLQILLSTFPVLVSISIPYVCERRTWEKKYAQLIVQAISSIAHSSWFCLDMRQAQGKEKFMVDHTVYVCGIKIFA